MSTDTDAPTDLKRRRIAAGLTQQRLAELAECSISIVSVLDRGLQPRRSQVMTRIEHVLTAHTPGR